MKRKGRIILILLVVAFTVLEITAILHYVMEEKKEVACAPSYVPSVPSSGASSSGSVTFRPVSTGIRHIQPIMPAHTVSRSTAAHYTPTVSTGWQIYRTSSHTVHEVGSGGGGGGAAGSTGGHGSSNRGIRASSGSVSIPSIAYTPMPLAARNIQDGMTAEQGLRASMPRRVIINDGGGDEGDYDEENLRPGYDPQDPFFTPVGDIPWLLMLLLGLAYCCKPILQRNRS